MKRQNFPKLNKLSQITMIIDPSTQIESYFIRYLAFQNKIVKKIKPDTNEILVS